MSWIKLEHLNASLQKWSATIQEKLFYQSVVYELEFPFLA